MPAQRRRTAKSRSITIEGVTANNLKNIDISLPLEAFVCITGVSGSGKSSLVNDTLAPALLRRGAARPEARAAHESPRGQPHR